MICHITSIKDARKLQQLKWFSSIFSPNGWDSTLLEFEVLTFDSGHPTLGSIINVTFEVCVFICCMLFLRKKLLLRAELTSYDVYCILKIKHMQCPN